MTTKFAFAGAVLALAFGLVAGTVYGSVHTRSLMMHQGSDPVAEQLSLCAATLAGCTQAVRGCSNQVQAAIETVNAAAEAVAEMQTEVAACKEGKAR